MKKDDYTGTICKGFCRYYKEGREGLTCGTYDFITRNLTAGEIKQVQYREPGTDFSRDKEIRELACAQCDFLIDGCDFRGGQGAPPCGGYLVIEWLLRKNA